jgi:hypothetical protein
MRRLVPIAAALLACVVASNAQACTIPVFRFALDRWAPDPYRLDVAPRDADRPEITRFLRNFGADSPLNLTVKRLPADQNVSSLRAPDAASPLWEGTLDGAALAALTDSPARRELIRRLLAGDNVVWVLAESQRPAANHAIAAVVEKRLGYLEQVAQLPAIDPSDPDSQLGPGPALSVRFSLLKAGPDEVALRRMLAGPESGLETSEEPWVAAVFGRGRVLGAWPAAEAGEAQIEQACLFLLGACSCQAKALNPGWDLLLSADWDRELEAQGIPALPPTLAAAQALPETVRITGALSAAPRASHLPIWIAALVMLLVLASGIRWRQGSPHR